jgi:hypothetical protein
VKPINPDRAVSATLLFLISLLSCCFSASASADGLYITTGYGQTKLPIKYKLPAEYVKLGFYTETKDTSSSVHASMMYAFNDRFSLGLGYHDLGNYSVCAQHAVFTAVKACAFAHVQAYSIESRTMLYGPIYLTVSAYRATATGDLVTRIAEYTTWAPVGGLGFKVPVGQHTALLAELRYPTAPRFMFGLEHQLK